MGWFIAQSLVFILVAFAIGLLVGWLIWGRRSDRTKTVAEESAEQDHRGPPSRRSACRAGLGLERSRYPAGRT